MWVIAWEDCGPSLWNDTSAEYLVWVRKGRYVSVTDCEYKGGIKGNIKNKVYDKRSEELFLRILIRVV